MKDARAAALAYLAYARSRGAARAPRLIVATETDKRAAAAIRAEALTPETFDDLPDVTTATKARVAIERQVKLTAAATAARWRDTPRPVTTEALQEVVAAAGAVQMADLKTAFPLASPAMLTRLVAQEVATGRLLKSGKAAQTRYRLAKEAA